ncbi:hemolysin D [Brasilonema octagenarum UFV-E1]|uniref:Hemolysin D n=2 Tax=Brasilonema TaxID=383614 RepID=A0A856MHA1_9CYAN|nr:MULTISPECIES: HlyD family efflux transporter periplasmic adaptor subunit [Brasilonema]NMF63025.1 hemolysin D [Brasilonema octagenarum UFV-OR1]QDL10745.1 hemolysin D [Brasilonema sennae CENA114]QDL17089.1 hemolysin D [Brasilonema octagenarum UFV-E1]
MSEYNGRNLQQATISTPRALPNEVKVPIKFPVDSSKFTPSVVLQQSPFWSRAVVWGLMAVTTSAVIWANVAKIEEAIPTQGKLEPQETVKEVQAPVNGVVKTVYVKDGQKVSRGDLLLRLDSTAAQAQLKSFKKIRTTLIQENQFYRTQINGQNAPSVNEQSITQLKLPPGLESLAKSRAALSAENRLYRLQLSGISQSINLTPEEQARLQFSQAELKSRIAADKLAIEQSEKQLGENQAQLSSAQDIRSVNQTILNNLESVVKEGAIARVQLLKQQQEVRTHQADVERLMEEQARLRFAIAQSKEKLQNTIVAAKKDLLTKIADNEKQIAQIDSELNKAILENEKKIAEIDSQISQSQVTLQYQEIRSSADGIVFDLQARFPGFVANSTQPVLKIVPNDGLMAKVFITNKDIGFVKEGMKVDVRIDSFPFSEFGDIKGELVSIGSDALPPDEIRKVYTFPAKIRLERQSLMMKNRELPLQSGMSVSANIKVRNRTVISIFTDLFAKEVDNMKSIR